MNLCEYSESAHAISNEVSILASEVEDDDFLLHLKIKKLNDLQ